MDIVAELLSRGFSRVEVLDGHACGAGAARVLLAVAPYEAEQAPAKEGAWIHPYYPVSQAAYRAAKEIAALAQAQGLPLRLQNELRVKPIFARMPSMRQGRNTLSYLEGIGSRFHVQIFACDLPLPCTETLLDAPKPLQCGSCTRCMEACPGHAIDEEGFHRERCLRNWQLGGQPMPEALRALLGNRLIGCDDCQRCCPHNPVPAGETQPAVSLQWLLQAPGEAAKQLGALIGSNLALPNRLLAAACLLAGNAGAEEHRQDLQRLCGHPSPLVREYAAWGLKGLAGEAAET